MPELKTTVTRREERVYGVSAIPGVAISAIIAVYYTFDRLPMLQAQGLGLDVVLWDIIPYVLIPGLLLAPLSFCLMYELLLRMEEKVSTRAQLRRLAERVFIQLAGLSILLAVYAFSLIFILPLTTSSAAFVFTAVVWSTVFYVVMRRFRRMIGRLEKGEW